MQQQEGLLLPPHLGSNGLAITGEDCETQQSRVCAMMAAAGGWRRPVAAVLLTPSLPAPFQLYAEPLMQAWGLLHQA